MSTLVETHPLTTQSVLFGNDADADSLAARLRATGFHDAVAGRLTLVDPAAVRLLHERIDEAAQPLLGDDLIEKLVEGWHKWERLQDTAKESATKPDEDVSMRLFSHRMTSTRDAALEVCVDKACIATVTLVVTARFDVVIADATLRAGRLVALGPGPCELTVTLEVRTCAGRSDVELTEPFSLEKSKRIDPSRQIILPRGGVALR